MEFPGKPREWEAAGGTPETLSSPIQTNCWLRGCTELAMRSRAVTASREPLVSEESMFICSIPRRKPDCQPEGFGTAGPRSGGGSGIPLPPWAGGAMTHVGESSTLALIRPSLRLAHLPPQGKALAKPVQIPFLSEPSDVTLGYYRHGFPQHPYFPPCQSLLHSS